MVKYEIVYDYEDERDIRDEFSGCWDELQECIRRMRENGCYNIEAACISDDGEDEDAWSSATDGDYSAASPWNAPGMSASDFVRGCF